jgi:translation initiation factor 1
MAGKSDPPAPKSPFHNPFASLGAFRKTLPGGDAPPAPEATPPEPAPAANKAYTAARAVVRMERSGRGGKEVTVIDHLEVKDRDQWLKALKSALGCGGVIEEDRLVLQGDHRKRLRTLLAARGVKKITVA